MDNKDIKGLRLGGLLVSAMVLLFFTVEAGAVVAELKFEDENVSGGAFTYAGGTNTLLGINIPIDIVVGFNTPSGSGTYDCNLCFLNFETGAGDASNAGGPLFQWAAGGTFEIIGTVVDNANTVISGVGPLLTGTWTSTVFGLLDPAGKISLQGFGTDTKDADLAAFFGVDPNAFVFSETSITGGGTTIDADGGFQASVTEIDIVNTAVPIPAAVWLFSSAMLGLIGIKRFGDRERHGMALAA